MVSVKSEDDYAVEDIIVMEALPGDNIDIPPGYGHVIINPGHDPLVLSKMKSRAAVPSFDQMIHTHGAGYFLLNARIGYHLVSNGAYAILPEPRLIEHVMIPEFRLRPKLPMYQFH
jgi:glucose-6-phosphate isomerase